MWENPKREAHVVLFPLPLNNSIGSLFMGPNQQMESPNMANSLPFEEHPRSLSLSFLPHKEKEMDTSFLDWWYKKTHAFFSSLSSCGQGHNLSKTPSTFYSLHVHWPPISDLVRYELAQRQHEINYLRVLHIGIALVSQHQICYLNCSGHGAILNSIYIKIVRWNFGKVRRSPGG